MTAVHFVVPDGIDDPARPSGGNSYDRHVCRRLGSLGWAVHEHPIPGRWPRPDAASLATLASVVERIPDDARVLLDGLVASTAPEVLVPQARRLRLVVLVHMPLGDRPADHGTNDARMRERAVLCAAAAVLALVLLPGRKRAVDNEEAEAVAFSFARCPGASYCGALARIANFGRRIRRLPAGPELGD